MAGKSNVVEQLPAQIPMCTSLAAANALADLNASASLRESPSNASNVEYTTDQPEEPPLRLRGGCALLLFFFIVWETQDDAVLFR